LSFMNEDWPLKLKRFFLRAQGTSADDDLSPHFAEAEKERLGPHCRHQFYIDSASLARGRMKMVYNTQPR